MNKEKDLTFNHYCAKHNSWWNTGDFNDCPKCIIEKKKKKSKVKAFLKNEWTEYIKKKKNKSDGVSK